jgi:PmbA protein
MPDLIGPDEVRRVSEAALEIAGADDIDGVEVLFMHEWGGLTRFASSAIHQSNWREDTGLRVRVVSEDRVGVVAANDFSPEGARLAAKSAAEMARFSTPDPLFPGLAPKAPVPESSNFDEATGRLTPDRQAEAVAEVVAQVGEGFVASGAYETTVAEIGLANSEGQFCWAPESQASITTVVTGGDGGNGFAERFSPRVAELDPAAVGRRASEKAVDSQNPRDLDAGTYEVVLEPAAVSTLVGFLSFIGFGGRYILEGRSPFTGKEGETVAALSITMVDDALSAETIGIPFDFEGTPKQRVTLIENGVFRTGVHDRRSGKQAGRESTGHALPAPNPDGAFPLNVFLEPGHASLEDMIAATRRGVLVTRFHYSNVVNPVESSITGMTRDGTFLIEDGEVKHPVKNFRFTQSILEALSATSMIGRDTEIASEFFFSASRVPALKVDRFTFTGKSDH